MLHFGDRSFNFFSLSLITHLAFIGAIFLFSYAQINFFDNNINYVHNNFDVVNVHLVDIPSQQKKTNTAKTATPLDSSGYMKANSRGANNNSSQNNISSTKTDAEAESKRYEYLLSQQFIKLSPIINELFSDLERISMWIKIDDAGNIIDSGVAENIPLAKLIETKRAIASLSPLPKPPLNPQELQQYLIPILIK